MRVLVEIRCPFKRLTKSGIEVKCNRIHTKVVPGSAGEGECRSCHRIFEYETVKQV